MAKYIKNIFFMLLFVVQAACSFDGSFPFDLGLSDARSFEEWCGLGTGFAGDQDPLINSHPESGIFVIEDSGNSFDSTPNEWGCGLGFSNVGSIVADDYLNAEERPEELLEGQGIGNETGAGNCLVESQALSVEGSSSSSSSSSSASSSNDEAGDTIRAFTSAVQCLPIVERMSDRLYACPISTCDHQAKKMPLMEGHLKSHHEGQVACIFCEKALYSQNIANSHYCKCPFCDVKCRMQANVVKFMTEHVQKRHPHFLAFLVSAPTPGGFIPDSSNSSSSSFDSSLNEFAKKIEAFTDAVKQLPIKSHNESQITCIFCKKELYSQENANSHNCKCFVCALEFRMPTGVIDRMAKHVRERHSQLAKELGIIQIDEGFARSSDGSSSSSLLIQIENARSKITYTCVLCTYSTGRKTDMYKHIYAKHFNASGVECPTCTSKIYEFDRTHRCKFPSEPQFTQAYLDAYPQFTEATYQELPELRRVKKCASTYYTCPYCDKWRDARDALNYHIYRLHTLARKETCLACGKPMYMKGGLEEHAGKCSAGDSVSSSSSSSSSSLLALTSALSASKSKRGRSSSSNVNEDVEEADAPKRLCTPLLQPVSPEQWSPLEFPFSEEQGDQFGDDSSKPSSLLIQIENARSKITYTCVLCIYSTGEKTDIYKHIYAKHFNAPGIECPTCTSKIYEFDTTHRCKFPSEPRFTQAYLDAYPQFTEATCQELPELRRVKKGASTYYTCPYCDKWREARGDKLNYHIYRLHTLARKETCLACGKPMYMKGGLEVHAGKCSAGDSVSSSSSSSSSSLLALTSALSASKSKRGRSSSSNVNEDVEEADALKRLCTPSLQPVSPEQWSPVEFPFSEEQGDQFGDDSSKSLG